MSKPVHSQILDEKYQSHNTRKQLYVDLEKELGRPVVTLFTSFIHHVMLDDTDADMLESVLQNTDLKNGLALIISSPGGDGLAAERIIKICRSYSKTGEFWVIVPSKAKSAATIVSFGASKIIAGPTSELGPVDPQITLLTESGPRQYSVFNIVSSYDNLFNRAVRNKTGRLEPYIQQLQRFDAKDIKEYRMALELSESISIQALHTGMMSGKSENDIKKKIAMFLSPTVAKAHGRPIYRDEAKNCDLNIEDVEPGSKVWKLARELYTRLNIYVSTDTAKCIENSEFSFNVAPQSE